MASRTIRHARGSGMRSRGNCFGGRGGGGGPPPLDVKGCLRDRSCRSRVSVCYVRRCFVPPSVVGGLAVVAQIQTVAFLLFGDAQPDRGIDHFIDDQTAYSGPYERGQRCGDLLHDLFAH